jgi:hypothetical protein
MKRFLIVMALCVAPSYAFAECPTEDTITAFGHTYKKGGLIGTLSDTSRDCDSHDQPAWLAKINEAAPAPSNKAVPSKAASTNAAPNGLTTCREIVRNKDPQYDAQRCDCIFWYGHSIEVQ